MSGSPIRLFALSVALTPALAATPLLAQQYRGDGGTLLDRNNQVGSGGKNTRARDIRDQIWFNNQIITGNAPGGRSFRGYVGYTAPNEFHGPTGSDAQYNFRRDSTSGAAVATGVRASDALRYQFSLTTGQAPPSYLANVLLTPRDSNAASGANITSTSSALRSTSDFLTSRSLRPTFVGSRTNAEGQELVASASPLLGITWQRVTGDPMHSPAGGGVKTDPLADTPTPPTTPGAPPPPTPTKPVLPSVTPGAPTGLTPTGLESRGVNYRPRWETDRAGERPAAKPDSLSGAVDTAVDTSAVPVRSAAHAQALDAVRTAYNASLAGASNPPKPDTDKPGTYVDSELERIRRVLRGQSPLAPTPTKPTTPDPLAADQPATTEPTPPPKPKTGAGAADKPDKRETSPLSPELIKALKSIGQKNLDSFVPTDSGSTNPASYQIHMESGQKFITDGRFFDAEDRFTRAIAAMPNDPLAKIGRIHAQLGAGMFLSASTNLRQLIKESPEVIGLKFDRKLAPDAARAKTVAEQLREGVHQGSTGMGLESSLLLAYLGRITGDQAMTDEGLGAMRLRLPANEPAEATLHEVLTGVWSTPK